MNLRLTLLATAATVGLGAYALPAKAEPALADGVCPAVGEATAGCDLVITFNADGSITTTAGASAGIAGGTYDGTEDTLIGVVNNTANVITSFNLSSTQDIFGFDGDGIDTYNSVAQSNGSTTYPATGNNPDTTGYGGPDGYFTNISADDTSGTVNFANGGIAANGGTDYFSLEEAISLDQAPTVTAAPEPATMAILGVGMLGAGIARRYRRRA
jgi:hypothetical protein